MSSRLDDPLAREHAALRAKAMADQKAFSRSPEGSLGALVMQAADIATRMKADGASDRERFAVVEATIRECWPRTRTWKYLCESCRDTGLVIRADVVNKLGCRVDEGVPCHCSAGARFRERPRGEDDDFTQAGKVTKPKGFTRFGR